VRLPRNSKVRHRRAQSPRRSCSEAAARVAAAFTKNASHFAALSLLLATDKAVNITRRLFLLGPLLFLAVIVIAWKFMAPSEHFLTGFARLLTAPAITRGTFSVFSGRSYATGTFQGRD
jgi:hypothetical protein